MKDVYLSVGDGSIPLYCQATEAYPNGEIFVVCSIEDVYVAMSMGPNTFLGGPGEAFQELAKIAVEMDDLEELENAVKNARREV